MVEKIGIMHPGQMGVSVAASAINSGHEVFWTSEGRSVETKNRADEHTLIDTGSLRELCETCSVIISVCPPHAAEDVADRVLENGYKGLYLDANAISPERARRIGQRMSAGGISFVDGGIIGGPAWKPGTTFLYLSGSEAKRAAVCFSAGPLTTEIIGGEIGKASALKMCFAAYTKGSTALLCAILAAAESLGVRDHLEHQWSRGGSDFSVQTKQRVQRVTAKAWRFSGEMEEIAATFEGVGLPGGFHKAAADIYNRIAHFKGSDKVPLLENVLDALARQNNI